MGRAEIYVARRERGKWNLHAEVKCSILGAWSFWKYLEDKYLPPLTLIPKLKLSRLTAFDENGWKEIWDLAEDDRLTPSERLVLMTTFDKMYLLHKDIPPVVNAMREVHEMMNDNTIFKEVSDILWDIYQNHKDVKAIGFNATSVTSHEETIGRTFNEKEQSNIMDTFMEIDDLIDKEKEAKEETK